MLEGARVIFEQNMYSLANKAMDGLEMKLYLSSCQKTSYLKLPKYNYEV